MPQNAEPSQGIPPSQNETGSDLEQPPRLSGSRLGRRRIGLFVSLALVVLSVIVVLTSLLMHFGSSGSLASSKQAYVSTGSVGLFVKSPYTPSQVNDLWHLVDLMTYRELANLYVTHMSLDEE